MAETYVTVATYTEPMEAEMARSQLEAEGIPALTAGTESAGLFSGTIGLAGSILLSRRSSETTWPAGLACPLSSP
jgi:hypothetical protein